MTHAGQDKERSLVARLSEGVEARVVFVIFIAWHCGFGKLQVDARRPSCGLGGQSTLQNLSPTTSGVAILEALHGPKGKST